MKLSALSTNDACDVMIRIAPPIARMASDEAVINAGREYSGIYMKAPIRGIEFFMSTVLPLAVKKHRADAFEVIAALTGKTADEVGSQPIITTFNDVRESIDDELIRFFMSAVRTEPAK